MQLKIQLRWFVTTMLGLAWLAAVVAETVNGNDAVQEPAATVVVGGARLPLADASAAVETAANDARLTSAEKLASSDATPTISKPKAAPAGNTDRSKEAQVEINQVTALRLASAPSRVLVADPTGLPQQAIARAAPADSAPHCDGSTDVANPCFRWEIRASDRTVRELLQRWCSEAKWQPPIWDLPVDIPIEAGSEIEGSFETVLDLLARSLYKSDTPIRITLYANRVLRVESYVDALAVSSLR